MMDEWNWKGGSSRLTMTHEADMNSKITERAFTNNAMTRSTLINIKNKHIFILFAHPARHFPNEKCILQYSERGTHGTGHRRRNSHLL